MTNGFHSPQPKIVPRIIMRNKKALEQVQICVGVPSHPITHERRHASYILNTLLGGGMSSRLFQNIRERQGLAYAIYSDLTPYRDTGCFIGLRGNVARIGIEGGAVDRFGIPKVKDGRSARRRAQAVERSTEG